MIADDPRPSPGGGAPTALDTPRDPVEDHLAALGAALHGPPAAKARLLEELRGGLQDSVAAYVQAGVDRDLAAELAVRDCGAVDDLLPSCQHELTIAQVRQTARATATATPLLFGAWYLLHTTAPSGAWHLTHTAHLLATRLTTFTALAALLAFAVIALTGTLARWIPTPSRLPRTVAWTSTVVTASMAVCTLVLATTMPLTDHWPLTTLATLLTAASHAVTAGPARASRLCARLPVPALRP
ncbi:permease prefix domain 1-containing protein [Streptomyces huiliensis]|uniref:permease prefix domain 1-containing protein n=1 Tax=Streptomyces huiliensis TaxID=2876027 RepID=UPI001CBD7060|nr:permease prefix domain 1-containing protein [Streptomyces huiliensis]MBZ4321270.1 permease prefix domain 1-containing protein [Streptomyces huiliensis]